MNDDDDGEWLTIAEAAARLGVRPVAIRRRIQRKTLRVRPADRENDGRTRVWIARTAGTGIETGAATGHGTGTGTNYVAAVLTEIADLRERLGRHEGTEAELRARLADRDRERDRLAADLVVERQYGRELAGRLDQLHERHRAEIEALRAELAAERGRPWWRRVRRR